MVCQREPKSSFQPLLPAGQFPVQSGQPGCLTLWRPIAAFSCRSFIIDRSGRCSPIHNYNICCIFCNSVLSNIEAILFPFLLIQIVDSAKMCLFQCTLICCNGMIDMILHRTADHKRAIQLHIAFHVSIIEFFVLLIDFLFLLS